MRRLLTTLTVFTTGLETRLMSFSLRTEVKREIEIDLYRVLDSGSGEK